MLTRERRSLVPPPTPPDFGRTGRKGAGRPDLPAPAALPSMSVALSRRAALFGAVTATGALAGSAARGTAAAPLSPRDARLVAIAAELQAVFDRTEHLSATLPTGEDSPEWGGLIARFEPLEDEMAELPADTMAGVLAKARGFLVPPVRHCQNDIGDSLAADLVRLFGLGALS